MKIVALLDTSSYASAVCDYAGWFASRGRGAIDLVHVLPSARGRPETPDLSGSIGLGARTTLLQELSELDEQQARVADQRGRILIDDARNRTQQNHGDLVVHGRLRHGDLVETVEELESEADLIVTGKRGEDDHRAEHHLGSSLERVVRASRKPVLVVNRDFHAIRRPLIAFDGGVSVKKAIEHLCRSPVFRGLEFALLAGGKVSSLDEAEARLRSAGHSVTVNQRDGTADTEIAAVMSDGEPDLLVMGAYGHSRIRNLIIGSTTTVMIRTAGTPLLLFR